MIKNTEIIRFNVAGEKDFDIIDSYQDSIKKYIYNDIDIMQSIEEPTFFQSRTQIIISSNLLRSLYLKEGIVTALNENNLPSLYANLKSFLEIPAMFGYVLHTLESGITKEEMFEVFINLTLGNKEAGDLSLGTRKSVNILTMFEKLEIILNKLDAKVKTGKIMSDFYKDICNYGHPNYNAHFGVIGNFDKDGVWRILEGKKEDFWGGYKPHLITAIYTIIFLCEKIVNHPKINNFLGLKNSHYFL